MARPLPFTAKTDTGETFDITFPLHPSTESAIRVHQLLGDLLETLTREIRRDPMANGDVMQAAAMALAIRARMIAADPAVTSDLARELLENALSGVNAATSTSLPVGHA